MRLKFEMEIANDDGVVVAFIVGVLVNGSWRINVFFWKYAYCDYPAAKMEREEEKEIWIKKNWKRINEIVYTSLDWFRAHTNTHFVFLFIADEP